MAKERFHGDGSRRPTSLLMDPKLARRLKVCSSRMGVSRSTLIERLCLEEIEEVEMQAAADEFAVSTD